MINLRGEVVPMVDIDLKIKTFPDINQTIDQEIGEKIHLEKRSVTALQIKNNYSRNSKE